MPATRPGAEASHRTRRKGAEPEQSGAPDPLLTAQGQERLEEERIRKKGPGRSGIRGRVEEVRICGRGAGPCTREPSLHERGQRRGRDEGKTERARQRPEEPQRGREVGGRRSKEAKPADRSREGDADPKDPKDSELPGRRSAADKQVRKGIAPQQRRLEEHHRGIPHRRRTAEHGQDAAHRERLDPEHEPRGGEDDDAVKPRWQRGPKQGRRLRGGGCITIQDGYHFSREQ